MCRLYQNQRVAVRCNSISREFGIQRGAKQGDPVSSIIFNAFLEQVMRTLRAKWKSKHHGIQLGHIPESVITNLLFADDILLVARTLPQLKHMIADVSHEGA